MFVFLIVITGVVSAMALAYAYYKTADPFHPLVLLAPMFFCLYVLLPVKLSLAGGFTRYLSQQDLEYAQLVNFTCIASFFAGCALGSSMTAARRRAIRISINPQKLRAGVIALGLLGMASYVSGLLNAGGFTQAYSHGYGGGFASSGYIADAVNLCVPAILLLLLLNHLQSPRFPDFIFFALFAAPFILQGMLGARRGPTFMVLASVGVGWYLFRNRRPRLTALMLAGTIVGFLLLFLVSNRQNIHLGSERIIQESPLSYLNSSPGNEYIYGAGAITKARQTGEYFWGRRYFAMLFVRPIPKQIWPGKYEAVGLRPLENGAAGSFATGDFRETLGWAGARGAATGLIADMYLEFGWLSLAVLGLIGWAYGRAWRIARTYDLFAVLTYTLMVALTAFLVFQTLEAMLFRFLEMWVPAGLVWRWSTTKHLEAVAPPSASCLAPVLHSTAVTGR